MLPELLEKQVRKICNIQSCIKKADSEYLEIIARAKLFGNITKDFVIKISAQDKNVKVFFVDNKQDFDNTYNDFLSQFVDINQIKFFIIKKNGLGIKTKNFCQITLKN